jgi:hypothetical protein
MCKGRLIALPFLLVAVGCSLLGGVTYRDPVTYKNLTDLKPQILFLYDAFIEDPAPTNDINTANLKA